MSLGKDISNFLSLVIQLKNMDISDNSTLQELESSMERYYLKKLKKELGEDVSVPVVADPLVENPIIRDDSSDDDIVHVAQEVRGDVAQVVQEVRGDVAQVVQEVSRDVAQVAQEVRGDVAQVAQEVTGDVAQVVGGDVAHECPKDVVQDPSE